MSEKNWRMSPHGAQKNLGVRLMILILVDPAVRRLKSSSSRRFINSSLPVVTRIFFSSLSYRFCSIFDQHTFIIAFSRVKISWVWRLQKFSKYENSKRSFLPIKTDRQTEVGKWMMIYYSHPHQHFYNQQCNTIPECVHSLHVDHRETSLSFNTRTLRCLIEASQK